MCGRAALGLAPDELQSATKARGWVGRDKYRPKYNVAPTSFNPVLRAASARQRGGAKDDGIAPASKAADDGIVDVDLEAELETTAAAAAAELEAEGDELEKRPVRVLHQMKWGLVASYEKEMRKDISTINARGESLESSGMWRRLLARRRAVYFCEGFYEWYKASEKAKERKPYFLHMKDPCGPRGRRLLPMAALYDVWRSPEGEIVYSYTVVTTAACKEILWLHDRMPVILDPEDIDDWIDPTVPWEKVRDRIRARRDLQWYEVSQEVNGIKIDKPDLIRPAAETRPRGIDSFFAKKPSPAKTPKADVDLEEGAKAFLGRGPATPDLDPEAKIEVKAEEKPAGKPAVPAAAAAPEKRPRVDPPHEVVELDSDGEEEGEAPAKKTPRPS
eukprot:tig00020944_g16385.t1